MSIGLHSTDKDYERERFHAWLGSEGFRNPPQMKAGHYMSSHVDLLWQCWQEAQKKDTQSPVDK